MFRNHQPKKQQGFITLMVIFGVGLFALAAALTLAVSTATELAKNKNTVLGDRATYWAEAAADSGAKQCLDFYSVGKSDPATVTCAVTTPGTISTVYNAAVNVTRDTTGLPYLYVTGSATDGSLVRKVVRTISWFPEGEAFLHAITAQGDVDLQGTSSVDGDIFSHGTVDVSGSADVDGAITQQNPNFLLPKINFKPYEDLAKPNTGKTFAATKDAEKDLTGKNNGVFYVADSSKVTNLGSSTKLNGTLVTAGSLKLTGGDYTFDDNKHPVMIIGGDLELSGTINITGLVYVCGVVKNTGGGSDDVNIRGSVVILGKVDNEVNYACNTANSTETNSLGGHFNLTFDSSIVSAWQNLVGFDLGDSAADGPKLVKWREQ